MPDSELPPQPPLPASAQNMLAHVGSRATRMVRARNRRYAGVWRTVALVGVIGWSVVIPMLAGIAVGLWIDRTWPGRFSWTLMLLVGGVLLGCINAWARVRDAQKEDD